MPKLALESLTSGRLHSASGSNRQRPYAFWLSNSKGPVNVLSRARLHDQSFAKVMCRESLASLQAQGVVNVLALGLVLVWLKLTCNSNIEVSNPDMDA